MGHSSTTHNPTSGHTGGNDGTLGLALLAGWEDDLPNNPIIWGRGPRAQAKTARRNAKQQARQEHKAHLGQWTVQTLAVAAATLPNGARTGFIACWRRKEDGVLVGEWVPNRFKAVRVAFHAGVVGLPESYRLLDVPSAVDRILAYQADVASEVPF